MKMVVLASGAGSTFEFLLNKQNTGELRPQIVGLLTDNPAAGALTIAQKHNIPYRCLVPKDYRDFSSWDQSVLHVLQEYRPDIVLLAGFLKKIGPAVLSGFAGRIFNTHPSLLPKFGGPGMYGRKVHQAVLAAGEKFSGVTIHEVTTNYDEGPIRMQAEASILPNETLESLESRIKLLEKETLLNFLNDLN